MTEPDDYVGPRWIPEPERNRIFQNLLKGPWPQPVDRELKASLLADVGPDEAELMVGLLDIIENGPADMDRYLAELHERLGKVDPGPSQ